MLGHRVEGYAVNFWRNFVIDVAFGIAFLCFGSIRHNGSRASAAALVFAGFFAWPLLEYLVHRHVLHGPWHALRKHHALHHRDPQWERMTAWYAHPLTGLAVGAPLAALWSIPVALLLLAGFYAGYTWFRTVHRIVHFHGETVAPRFLGSRLSLHGLHHDYPDRLFGVTTSMWDRVFGTFRTP